MPKKKGHRRRTVGQQSHQRPTRSNRALPPVVYHPQSEEQLTRRPTDEAPADDEVGPPQCDPEPEEPRSMRGPVGISGRADNTIQESSTLREIPVHRLKQ